MKCHKLWLKFFQIGLSMECTRWRKNQQAYLEVIWKENKTDDVICLHFGVYGNTCGHMIPSSVYGATKNTYYVISDLVSRYITKTCPCNVYPLKPHFYIAKLGYAGYTFFFISAPKHRLWVLVRTASARRF